MKTKEVLSIPTSLLNTPAFKNQFQIISLPDNVPQNFMQIPIEWKETLNETFGHIFADNSKKINFLIQLSGEKYMPESKVLNIEENFTGFEFKPYLIGLIKKYKFVKVSIINQMLQATDTWLIIRS